MNEPLSESDVAQQFTRFLLERDGRYGYDGKSPLMKFVEAEIRTIAAKIAHEVVASHPKLEETIRLLTVETVANVLREDASLQETVIASVTKALARRRSGDED